MIYITLISAILIGAVAFVALFIWWLNRNAPQPKDAPSGSSVSLVIETVMFVIVAAVMFTFYTTRGSSGGLLLELNDLRPVFVRVYLSLVGILLLILIFSAVCVLRKKTTLGITISFAAVFVFVFITDGPFDLLRQLVNLF